MTSGKYVMTEEHKRKVVETRMKNNSYKLSDEAKKKISKKLKMLYSSVLIPWIKGKHHSDINKIKMSLAKKGKPSNRKGMKHSTEAKQKMSNSHRGYNPSIIARHNMSICRLGSKNHFFGKHHSLEVKKKISEKTKLAMKRLGVIGFKGRKHTLESKKKMSIFHKGKHNSEEHNKHISEAVKKMWSNPEIRRKISESLKGRISGMKGKHLSEETKLKLRIALFDYVKKIRYILYPCIGHNEKQILDDLEIKLNKKILRQHQIAGYFLDGYVPEINLAIEVDEKPKDKERDIERQKEIEDKLGCTFMRINDFGSSKLQV